MARVDRGPGVAAPAAPAGGRPPKEAAYKIVKTSDSGVDYIDYKDTESLRRMMSNNGKLHGRRRNSATAMEQRMIAQAVKRARFMGLLPYVETSF
jgi:small subunit ribosomal protein S18